MLKLIIFLLLIFGALINSNAAEILDNSLMDVYKKKEKMEPIKTDGMHFLNENSIKAASEYEIELISIFKKNLIKHGIQGKPANFQQFYLTDSGGSQFIQGASNGEINAQTLLEAEMDWVEIKAELKDATALLSALNTRAANFLDEYLSQNINTNLVLGVNIKVIRHSSDNPNFHDKKSPSEVVYRGNEHMKTESFNYKTPSSYNEQLNSVDSSDGETKSGDEKKMLSIIYLWKIYSDTIIAVLSVIATLWLVIASLIKFLTWNS